MAIIKTLDTPVLLVVFNRLDTTVKVFESIKKVRPSRFYLASDGARDNRTEEEAIVARVRNYVLEHIDWECEVQTLFQDKNLGCKIAVSKAITWFFKNENEGIILEDDCLPSDSFFWFCQDLLFRFRNDLRIWQISGNNFLHENIAVKDDYYFSKYNHIWGWATWANRWEKYSVELDNLDLAIRENSFGYLNKSKREKKYWLKNFNETKLGKIDTWDYQWTYSAWINSGLTVIPNKNLISNIGFGENATHTTDMDSKHSNMSRYNLEFPLKHPKFIVRNVQADEFTAANNFNIRPLWRRVLSRIQMIINTNS